MQPRLEQSPALRLVGPEGLFSDDQMRDIPALWQRLRDSIERIPGRRGDLRYGVCRLEHDESGKQAMRYAAAVETDPGGAVPAGLVAIDLPAGRFAVFTHEGPIHTIGATWDNIWQQWIPASKLTVRAGAQFERYDERFHPMKHEGAVEIWIPVQ